MYINYFNTLGGEKKLHEIVIPGTHDAGISGDNLGANARTQDLNILEQAKAGVRFFDLRIAAQKVANPNGPGRVMEMRAYHANEKFQVNYKSKQRNVLFNGMIQQRNVEKMKLIAGDWGESLSDILTGAISFLQDPNFQSEFLLFKFDKCKNWQCIAEAAVQVLGNTMYNGSGHLNTKTLQDLRGKVIILFSAQGMAEIRDAVGNALYQANQDHNPNNKPHVKSGLWSIQQWENLQKDRTSYCDVRRTLQYYGQFGDSAFSLTTNSKFEKNKLIQLQTLGAARNLDRRVLRMMYWTTTGLKQSIEDRNDTMWRRDRMREFLEVWQSGMGGNILQHSPFLVHQNPKSMMGSVAQQIREYFPNIIMIDFADPGKCRYIFNLNLMTTGQLQSEESWLRNLLFSYY